MPESGYYEKRPRPEQREFLVAALSNRPVVSSVEELDDFRVDVIRPRMTTLRIYLTNKYTLSVADAMEILASSPEVNCIVSTMDYNEYSPEAKEFCMTRGVGLFRTRELLGAVYRNGSQFLAYVPPSER